MTQVGKSPLLGDKRATNGYKLQLTEDREADLENTEELKIGIQTHDGKY